MNFGRWNTVAQLLWTTATASLSKVYTQLDSRLGKLSNLVDPVEGLKTV